MNRWLTVLLVAIAVGIAAADFDYRLRAQPVADGVYVFVGKTEEFTPINGGNIVNTGFIVGENGVIVIDSGPSARYGRQMRQAIAAITDKPVALVVNTHHHPDHFLGNQAFADRPLGALEATRHGISREGNAFAENLYRLSGDWMLGTEAQVPNRSLQAGPLEIAGRRLRLVALDGHTAADLVVLDEATGTLFTGDLVFNGRAPTTPHADVTRWLAALDTLEALMRECACRTLVPGHGNVARDAEPIRQTRAWLTWLTRHLREGARDGLDMTDMLARPLPAEFAAMPMAREEYRRSISHLFPAIEQDTLRTR